MSIPNYRQVEKEMREAPATEGWLEFTTPAWQGPAAEHHDTALSRCLFTQEYLRALFDPWKDCCATCDHPESLHQGQRGWCRGDAHECDCAGFVPREEPE